MEKYHRIKLTRGQYIFVLKTITVTQNRGGVILRYLRSRRAARIKCQVYCLLKKYDLGLGLGCENL